MRRARTRSGLTDVTESRVKGEKLYLSPIVDLFNNEVISFEIARRPCAGTFDFLGHLLACGRKDRMGLVQTLADGRRELRLWRQEPLQPFPVADGGAVLAALERC